MGQRPLVAATSILGLAVGIGACAVSWTLIEAVLLRPYGLEDVDRLVVVTEADAARNQPLIEVSYLNFLDWQREARTFESMAALGSQHWPALAKIGADMVPLATRGVTATFFPVLGVGAILGRTFDARDAAASVPPPLILSHRLWQSRFNGRTSIVGEKVFLDGTDHLVIGVMPAGFAFPDDPDAWVSVERILGEAFQGMPVDQQRKVGVLEVLGKRQPSRSNEDVRAELTAIVHGLQQRYSPTGSTTIGAAITPFASVIVGRLGERLWIALGMSAAVLLLACANVAAARTAHLKERSVELTTRLFLGSTRTRLASELAAETVPLIVCGALASAVVWLLLIDLLSPSTSIRASGVTLRDRWLATVVFVLGGAVVNWCAVGVWPAFAASRRTGDPGGGSTRVVARASRIGVPLLFGQAALAIAVVAVAGAAVQTFQRLSSIDFGFATRGVTLVDFSLPAWKYRQPSRGPGESQSAAIAAA